MAYYKHKPRLPIFQGRHALNHRLVGCWSFFRLGSIVTPDFPHWIRDQGSLINGPTWDIGKLGSHLNFTAASSQYVNVASTTEFDMGNRSFAISVWFKLNSTAATGSQCLVGKDASGARQFALLYSPNGNRQLRLVYFSGGVGQFDETASAIIPDTDWHHVVAQRVGDSIQISLDGVPKTTTGASGFTAMDVTTADLRFGSRSSGGDYLDGSLADVRIWNRSLLPAEITDLYVNPWALYTFDRRKNTAFIQAVASMASMPIETLLTIIATGQMPIEHVLAKEIISAVLLDSTSNVQFESGVQIESLLTKEIISSIVVEALSSYVDTGGLDVETLLYLQSLSNLNIDTTENINIEGGANVESNLSLQGLSNMEIEAIRNFNVNNGMNVENLGSTGASGELDIESLLSYLASHSAVVESLLSKLQSGSMPVEWELSDEEGVVAKLLVWCLSNRSTLWSIVSRETEWTLPNRSTTWSIPGDDSCCDCDE